MEIELDRLELRYEALRIADAGRQARLVASLVRHGQHSPVLVVAEDDGRLVLIDGYARVAALRQLGRDCALATTLEVGEAEALILAHRLASERRRSALVEGWLITELVERHGLGQRTVARRLQRSASWVCRRLALVSVLPPAVQAAVKAGLLPPQGAMKHLGPLSRANADHCERLVAGLGATAVTVRQLERLYLGWRRADELGRQRIVDDPWLFLKADEATRPAPAVPDGDPAAPLLADLDGIAGLSRRARRRVREGVLAELDDSRRQLVDRSAKEAALAFESLSQQMSEAPS